MLLTKKYTKQAWVWPIKNDVIDSIRLQLFSPQKFTAVKNSISHLKGHKICFLEKKGLYGLTTFQKKKNSNHKKLEISHNILAQLKYWRNTLLRKCQVNSKYFSWSMTKYVLKTGYKTTISEINYDSFSTKTTGSHFSYRGNRQSESQVTCPYLNLHNLYKTSFTEDY